MKICIAFHACMDLGGIINHTEQLIGGFQDLGHDVDLFEMVYADKASRQRKTGDFVVGPSGIPHDQGKGWNFENHQRLPYKTWAGVHSAQQVLNSYDMVIWTVPVVPKNKNHLGNDKWPHLYDLDPKVKQVAFVHDGNCKSGAPHLYHVADKLSGLACVHACALNGASHLPIPRTLVVNPQDTPIRTIADWDDKNTGFVNMQTFKAWKHAHELVEAIAYMPPKLDGELREIAGRGIEYQYMTSEDKCKENYFHSNESVFEGRKFWDVALDNGMVHHDYWPTDEVTEWLEMARVLVDPSWSVRYSKIGGHWNRVVVDAMIHGAIPVAQARGMGDEMFEAGVHYVDLGEARDAQDYADIVLGVSGMSSQQATEYRDNAHDILSLFDRREVAAQVIDLAHGNLSTQIGEIDPAVWTKYEDLMFEQYGILV